MQQLLGKTINSKKNTLKSSDQAVENSHSFFNVFYTLYKSLTKTWVESYSMLWVVSEKSGATLDELLMPRAKLIQKGRGKKTRFELSLINPNRRPETRKT